MTTNRDNSFRLADSHEAVRNIVDHTTLHFVGDELSYTALSANNALMNTITFNTNNTPILELKPNGDIYVQGRLAANDLEVVSALRQFLTGQGLLV